MPHPLRFGVYYDFRNPPGSGMTTADLYRRTLDQIRAVDRLGYESVWMSEHHFTEDGYMPSVVAMSAAIAAVTEKLAISQDVLLMPFQHGGPPLFIAAMSEAGARRAARRHGNDHPASLPRIAPMIRPATVGGRNRAPDGGNQKRPDREWAGAFRRVRGRGGLVE